MCKDEFIASNSKSKERKPKTAAQALQSLMRLAARSEKSSGDAMRLMQRWGVPEADRKGVLEKLIESRFIDDRRYAEAYTREKSNLAGWGPKKIALQLRIKGIESHIIDEALRELDSDTRRTHLDERLRRKLRTTKAASHYELRGKLLRYALSLGYDYDLSISAIEELISEEDI
jgi:regulatory protein